jgi:hypothetical protein
MTELEKGDKPVFKQAMNIEPEDTALGGRFRRSKCCHNKRRSTGNEKRGRLRWLATIKATSHKDTGYRSPDG